MRLARRRFTTGLFAAFALLHPWRAWARHQRPDLIVTAIAWSPAEPIVGDAVTFSATVKNQGTAATPAGVITGAGFYVGGGLVALSNTRTASIPAGASVTLTANDGPSGSATWSAVAGMHAVRAHVDGPNRIAESNESNNTFTATLTVADPAARPDLVVTGLRWSEDDGASWHTAPIRAGSNVLFEAAVKNQGTAPTPAGVITGVAFFINGTKVSYSDNHTAAIPAGSTVSLRPNGGLGGGYWTDVQAGTYTARAYVDDINRIPSELDETNNTLDRTIDVTAAPPSTANFPMNGQWLLATLMGRGGGNAMTNSARTFAYRFTAERSGAVDLLRFNTPTRSGYYAGDGGIMQLSIREESGGQPGGVLYQSPNIPKVVQQHYMSNTDPAKYLYAYAGNSGNAGESVEYRFGAPVPLTRGKDYFIVWHNAAADHKANFFSINNLFQRSLPLPWNDEYPYYSTTDAYLGTLPGTLSGGRGVWIPYWMLRWQDGVWTGNAAVSGGSSSAIMNPGSLTNPRATDSSAREIRADAGWQARQRFRLDGYQTTLDRVWIRAWRRTSNTSGNLNIAIEREEAGGGLTTLRRITFAAADVFQTSYDNQEGQIFPVLKRSFADTVIQANAWHRVRMYATDSAVFALRAIQIPWLSLNAAAWSHWNRDGGRAEYSTDGGATWRGMHIWNSDDRNDLMWSVGFRAKNPQ